MSNKKEVLGKGIRYLAVSLPLCFLGPSILYSSFNNQDKFLFIPVLILGLLITFAAGYCIFKGIKTLMKALFDY
ncbi:DUF6095 family protein [Psychroflexus planctonicus]|uniref:Uncharacterized protein n=1 Tax=Psychroflexus planctonicus TaxID=1526575 RepID=A0ABQ1SK82_9FLAO|nr:DUF6095 family protein [Psychroflexus planctonicus]GGE44035.1 hypothetical protein GCM10010832_25080 [Psychroflexus planctonicus]